MRVVRGRRSGPGVGFGAQSVHALADLGPKHDAQSLASFHAILFAQGRQIFSLFRAGYLPSGLSLTHGGRQTPIVAVLAGSGLGLAFMLILSAT